MGRSEPGGEKERELARMATMVIAAGRREGRQTNDWRTFNEKSIKQDKTGLFIQNLCETEHQGDYERAGIFILESRRDLGRLYEMAPVRIACEAGGFSLARGQMGSEEKKQSVLEQSKSLTSAGFGDFASYSLQLFSIWSRVFAFACIFILISFYLN